MKCPKCRHENPEDARFCSECAHKFELACTECGKVNPPGSKFCNDCGHSLTFRSKPAPKDLSFDEKLAKIQRYFPKALAEKILAQSDRIEGESSFAEKTLKCQRKWISYGEARKADGNAYGRIFCPVYGMLTNRSINCRLIVTF